MNKHKINIRFVISSSRVRKDGRASLMCRLTYAKVRKAFATGLFVNPKNWNSKQQLVKPPEIDRDNLNTQLSLIKSKINKAFLMIQVKEESFSIEDIYSLYKGEESQNEDSVLAYYEKYLKKLKPLIGIDIKQVTWNKFNYIKNDLESFIKIKYQAKDYLLKSLELQFLSDFEYFLKVEKKQKQITINKSLQRFRKVIKVAVAENYLVKDPFIIHKPKTVKKEVVFLSPKELELLEQSKFSQARLNFVKDLFIFCCYSGLPYRELMDLKQTNNIRGFDGNLWIKMKCKKTSKELSVKLLPEAETLYERYKNEGSYLFARISNQKYNSYLKETGKIVGNEKKLTTHMARRTFASTVLLYNNVPMEILIELLGHCSIKSK